MQSPDPSPWRHSWGLPSVSWLKATHLPPFSTSLFSSQFFLHRGQSSRHVPVPDLFFDILDEISLHMTEEVLRCTGKKSTYVGARNPSD